jgi:Xaa-Pro aminopeptidase
MKDKTKKTSGSARLLIGDADTCVDIEYASGFHAVDPIVFFLHGRRRVLVVPDMEATRAQREAHRCVVYTPRALGIQRNQLRSTSSWAAALLAREKMARVSVAPTFPLATARALERKGVRVDVVDPLFPDRAIKTADEIRNIAGAQRAAVEAMRAATEMIRRAKIAGDRRLMLDRKPLTSERVRACIDETLIRLRCICELTIVAGGRQSADPHERGSGPLHAQDPIVIDIFPRHLDHGYWGDITRTLVKGTPSAELTKMYRAVKRAQREALQRLKPGVVASGIHAGVVKRFVDLGFATGVIDGKHVGFFHGTGHGVGMEIHEAPNLGLRPTRLRAGQVVTVEPGLYYPDIGGVRIEDTVAVTRTGWKYLATCEKGMLI